jgi:hypothetical protein
MPEALMYSVSCNKVNTTNVGREEETNKQKDLKLLVFQCFSLSLNIFLFIIKDNGIFQRLLILFISHRKTLNKLHCQLFSYKSEIFVLGIKNFSPESHCSFTTPILFQIAPSSQSSKGLKSEAHF